MITLRWVEAVARDARYGWLQFRRSPGVAATIILSLALGIGANTALFTVVNALMLRGAAVPNPGTLLAFGWLQAKDNASRQIVASTSGGGTKDGQGREVALSFPYPGFTYIRSHARSVSGLAGFAPLGLTNQASITIRGEAWLVEAEMVTGDYFATLGIRPALGREITSGDERRGAPRVAVLSDAFFTRAFAGERSVIGTTLAVNGVPVTIVGVAPLGFTGLATGRPADLWLPLTFEGGLTPWGIKAKAPDQFLRPDNWWLQVVGRLAPGATEERARTEFAALLRASYAGTVPDEALNEVPEVAALPAASAYNAARTRFSKALGVLGGVVGVILLVACANVATLLLARAAARRREVSLRLAVGASRGRLIRQLLTEHALYAAAGAAVGLLFASWGGRVLLALLSTGRVGPPVLVDVTLDGAVLAFTATVAVLTTLLFGVVPAVRATRTDVASDLKDSAGALVRGAPAGRFRLGRLFVAVQVALTVPLVVGAGLFLRTLVNLQHEPLGFDSERLLLFNIDLAKAGYKDEGLVAANEELRRAIGAMPGVRSATFSVLSLISGWTNSGRVRVEGQAAEPGARGDLAYWNAVAPRFIETMGMRLLLGRGIDERDGPGAPRVAVVNETMARRFFGGTHAIGARFASRASGSNAWVTVVGVVADAKYRDLRHAVPPTYFVPYQQTQWPLPGVWYEVRTAGEPLALVAGVREIARRVAPGAPLTEVKTQGAQIAQSLGEERMFAALFGFFGLTALLLACLGLHGTMAYTLRRRTREIGIRMALGARPQAVVRMALRETLLMTLAGMAAGAALAWAGARFVSSLLFGLTPMNPPTLGWAALAMALSAVAAGVLPARRAAKIEPLRALREE